MSGADRPPPASEPAEVTIKVREHGPLLVRGRFRLVDHQGNAFDVGDDVVLCRCGKSADKPFCDGTHRAGFDGTCARRPPGTDRGGPAQAGDATS